ncbi:hypothetical protein A3Q29_21080 [Providencia stuartii]|uniref:Uncharacterized protein n=1 Tax=Providencia stuartii TaxID=588 RepID=A0A1S1HM75_PROST|nr:hypothetical protein A3Q29_21080 [Providencia stuartii]
MPDIMNPISYTSLSLDIIKSKKENKNFNYKDWGDESLTTLRTEIRNYYKKTQNGVCVYCQNSISIISPLNCHVEHIAPKSLYEKFIFEPRNLCVVCADCNTIKREQEVHNENEDVMTNKFTNYPRSSKAFKIYHPHFDIWAEHIICFNGIYADITDKGANTIRICKLNRRLREFGVDERFINHPEVFHVANQLLQNGKIEEIKKNN